MIYFDNAATTATFLEALKTFEEVNTKTFGNSESNHAFGHEASKVLEDSRKEILTLLDLEKTHNLIFTSGATESNNLAIKGTAIHYEKRGKRLITSLMEHPSVLRSFEELRDTLGFDLVVLPITSKGVVDPSVLAKAMNSSTILVSIMAVNNEIGTVDDIKTLGSIVHQYPKALFHVDATQAMGKWPLDYKGVDLLSFSGHKFGGLKGTGALIYRKPLSFYVENAGGEQEYGFRAGTVNVAGQAAMAKALEIALSKEKETTAKVASLYQKLYEGLINNEEVSVNSLAPNDPSMMPYVLNFSLKKKKASVVVEALSNEGIYVSSVSACSSKESHASYVLKGLGKSEDLAENSIRVSFGINNTLEEVDIFLKTLNKILREVKDR